MRLTSVQDRIPLPLLALLLLAACASPTPPADLILRNGKIVTLEPLHPEASALAITEGRITALGEEEDVDPYRGDSTQTIDLGGRLAVPGFIEGHGHFLGIGQAKMMLDLRRAAGWEEIVAMVAEAAQATPPGAWIRGRGWHQEKWSRSSLPGVDGVPLHDTLSQASPRHPVILTHASGHASLVNARAMELAGLDRNTPDPPGGTIVRDDQGDPTGLLRETAQGLVRSVMADPPDQALQRHQAELAAQECVSKGVTSFQDAGSSFQVVDLLKALVEEKKMPLRLWVMLREDNQALARRMKDYRIVGLGDQRLTVRAVKRSIDGALGSHGAWLLQPYSDLPSSSGLNTTPIQDLEETARLALENDFQLCVHAIGDRANRETLDLFERALRDHPGKTDLRWRIEHAQHLDPADIPRFAPLGAIASMQGVHATSDGPWVPQRLGAARTQEGAYVWKKLIQAGALVTNGTDAPVEDVDPIASYYATVSRRLKDGTVFLPEQRLSREEALRTYTLNAAYAAFEEDAKGSLAVGKLADITVLSRDILTVAEEAIPATEVLYTIVGGQIVYRQD